MTYKEIEETYLRKCGTILEYDDWTAYERDMVLDRMHAEFIQVLAENGLLDENGNVKTA